MSIFKPSKKTNNSHLKNLRIKITARFGQFPKFSKPPQPISENEIRQRAFELWQARGGHSSDIDNWNEAKRQLEQEQIQRTKVLRKIASLANQPLIFVEKSFLEPCADWFERAAIFQIIEKLSPIIEAIGVLLIPLAIWWFTESNEEIKDRQEKAIRGQQAVQNYLNQLSNILLQGGVEKLENNKQLQNIMRASTLALFENPDLQNEENDENTVDRKGQVIKYLSETGLIQSSKRQNKLQSPIISLAEANLQGANLKGANLQFANLEGANLQGANLLGAYLLLANLKGANLKGANLKFANLLGADLKFANLEETNLKVANLRGAKYTDESTNLEVCLQMLLKYSCTTKFPTGFDPKASKMVLVDNLENDNYIWP
ncbi:pentapeptide repeat-containing protein [Nostoc cycadae]|uniref:Pentapeptide repeat protein n=1 Tax=Nostoc cycadae WK-1 TaxID=1861711 RepID=A0A2H6LR58_9NOSO|nr:pentapeptide repeat-containing protein [Nostoc cycadae]GBE95707.1 pentapeptide repeat protein [Nostoc cycadae WK-1]